MLEKAPESWYKIIMNRGQQILKKSHNLELVGTIFAVSYTSIQERLKGCIVKKGFYGL